MTAGTVVITGGILATVILLCIIAVLCYCRLQVSAVADPHLAMNPSSVAAPWDELLLQGGVSKGFFSARDGQGVETPFPARCCRVTSLPPPRMAGGSPKAFETLQHLLV